MTTPVVTIDGPSGAGKGTVGQRLAIKRHWHYLDSGALYRVTGLLGLRHDCLDDVRQLVLFSSDLSVRCEPGENGVSRIWLDAEDISEDLRDEAVSHAASQVAAIPDVRRALLRQQRDFRRPPGLVADGRDMGSTVFPDAIVKIYLTASAETRAKRRYKQLKEQLKGGGTSVSLATLTAAIEERDQRDMSRAASPLRLLEDAQVIDTSDLTMDKSLEAVEMAIDQVLNMADLPG